MFVSIVAPVFIILKVSLMLSPSAVPCEVVAQEDLVGVLPIAPLSSDAFEVPHELAIDVEGDALFTLSFVFSLSVFFLCGSVRKTFFLSLHQVSSMWYNPLLYACIICSKVGGG